MFDIFVSYRTVDERFGAAATHALLAIRFGAERIFLDNQSIPPGSRYPQRLRDALESMRVLLVLIGPQWLAADPEAPGRRLIDRDGDWVRREIRTALRRGVPVVPVLLDGVPPPAPDALPDDVRGLAYHQALSIGHRNLGADAHRLADVVDDLLADGDPRTLPVPGPAASHRVRELADPVALGVHPSPIRAAPSSGLSPNVPAYVPRDVADRMAWALTATPFVLVVGDATAGKTRLAYETVRRTLPDHWLIVPDHPLRMAETVARTRGLGDRVVWLDDIARYFGPNGLTADIVSALTRPDGGHVVLVGTIRSHEHAELGPRQARRTGRSGQPRSRLGRDVVRLAYEIHLARRWSVGEIGGAAASPDPRVVEAARHAHEFGVAEYLAAGPQLLTEWRDAWAPGNHPRGAALVAAAVDVCRAGVRRGVGVDLLRRLHTHYLTARGGTGLRPEPFDAALAWATEPLHATSGLLVAVDGARYRPFGYLIDAAEADPMQPAVPEPTWRILIAELPPRDCWHVGEAAYARRHWDIARSAFERATATGGVAAELRIADCVGESGKRADALAAVRAVVIARTRSDGRRHPDTLAARQALAWWVGRTGDRPGAVRLLAAIVRDLAATEGPDHPDTLTARHALANWTARAGRLDDAITEQGGVVAARTRLCGPDHPDTMASRYELARCWELAGRFDDALREHEAVASARARVLGAEHPDTLRSRRRVARLACRALGTGIGLPLLAKVVADRARVLGPDHPDTLRGRREYARWAAKAATTDENPAPAGEA